jgi:predicted nicotinamide N-methyase
MIEATPGAPPPAVLAALLDRCAPFGPAPLCPEIQVFQARSLVEIWEAAERLAGAQLPAPFWAYPWAGGAALARVLLDVPGQVRGGFVLDFGAGGGVASIAAARAGAARVVANDLDPWALATARLAASRQDLVLDMWLGDLTAHSAGPVAGATAKKGVEERTGAEARVDAGRGAGRVASSGAVMGAGALSRAAMGAGAWSGAEALHGVVMGEMAREMAVLAARTARALPAGVDPLSGVDVLLCSELAYEKSAAAPQRAFLERALARGIEVVLADAGRAYFDSLGLPQVAEFTLDVPQDLEGVTRRVARVFRS